MTGKDPPPQSSFGALLRALREAANLTQDELAGRSGLSLEAIGALERGDRRSPRSSTIEFLATALGLDAPRKRAFIAAARGRSAPVELPGETPDPSFQVAAAGDLLSWLPTNTLPPRAPLPTGSRMPLAPNPLFVSREAELLQIAGVLRGSDTTVAIGQVVASTGLGGLGKTQLAVEFVHRFARFFAGGVFWLSFGNADEIPLQVAACAAPEFETRSLEERVRLTKDAWQAAMPRLLVFDNCEEEGLLEAWRPTSGGCRVLVTSRRSHWSPTLGVTALPLDLLPRADSIELLRRYRPDLMPDDRGLDVLAAELGDLPLALHLAGSYLRAYRAEVSLPAYLVELERSDVVKHASLLGAGLDDSPSPTHHAQSVAQTFALCLGRLDCEREVDRVAIAMLARMACVAPGEPVPRELLAKTLEEVDPIRRADGLRRLGAAGLVEESEGWLRLHRLLVQFVRHESLDPDAQAAVARVLIGCGEDAVEGHLAGSALAAVIPHLIEVAGNVGREIGDERLAADLGTAAGQALQFAGDLRAARQWYDRALAIRDRTLGPDHPATAESLHNLAGLLFHQGELAAAKALEERALAIRERMLGSDHPATAESLNDLGVVLFTRGEVVSARPLLERALAIRERVLGPCHPLKSESLTNLAWTMWALGELTAARELFERALAIQEPVLGPEHPQNAFSVSGLAHMLAEQGELAAARPLLERALAIREGALGPDHPYTALSLNNLAWLLREQGESATARALSERALAIQERVLEPDHPDTAQSLHILGTLLRDEGELDAARPLLERALDIRERVLVPNHRCIASNLNDLALLFQAQGKLDAAQALFRRALASLEVLLGLDHQLAAISLHHLAALLHGQGDLTVARPLFERALAIRERVLGPDHPDTVGTRRALAELAADGDGTSAGD